FFPHPGVKISRTSKPRTNKVDFRWVILELMIDLSRLVFRLLSSFGRLARGEGRPAPNIRLNLLSEASDLTTGARAKLAPESWVNRVRDEMNRAIREAAVDAARVITAGRYVEGGEVVTVATVPARVAGWQRVGVKIKCAEPSGVLKTSR